jgi:hypothetical protein
LQAVAQRITCFSTTPWRRHAWSSDARCVCADTERLIISSSVATEVGRTAFGAKTEKVVRWDFVK